MSCRLIVSDREVTSWLQRFLFMINFVYFLNIFPSIVETLLSQVCSSLIDDKYKLRGKLSDLLIRLLQKKKQGPVFFFFFFVRKKNTLMLCWRTTKPLIVGVLEYKSKFYSDFTATFELSRSQKIFHLRLLQLDYRLWLLTA